MEDILKAVLDVLVEVRVLLFERFSLAHVDQVPSRLLRARQHPQWYVMLPLS